MPDQNNRIGKKDFAEALERAELRIAKFEPPSAPRLNEDGTHENIPTDLAAVHKELAAKAAKERADAMFSIIQDLIAQGSKDALDQQHVSQIIGELQTRLAELSSSMDSTTSGGGGVSSSFVAGPNITINQVGNTYQITGSGGGSATLVSGTVGYGTGANVITGSTKFTYDDNANRLSLSSSTGPSASLFLGISPLLAMSTSYGTPGLGLGVAQNSSIVGRRADGVLFNNILSWGNYHGIPDVAPNSINIGETGIDIYCLDLRAGNNFLTIYNDDQDSIYFGGNQFVVSTVSSYFNGPATFQNGLSGSLQRTLDGSPAFIGASGITITTQSNGSIAISGSTTSLVSNSVGFGTAGSVLTGVLDMTYDKNLNSLILSRSDGNSHLFLGVSSARQLAFSSSIGASGGIGMMLGNQIAAWTPEGRFRNMISPIQFLTARDLFVGDDGWGSVLLYQQNSSIILSGGNIVGNGTNMVMSASSRFLAGLSGSLQRLADGTPAFVSGTPLIAITTQSNGAVVISGSGWQTLYEVDLTAQGTQTMGSNGFYTIDGKTWRLENAVNALSATLVNGTGLVIQVNANASDYTNATRTGPIFSVGFNQFTSSLDLTLYETRILCFVTASNITTNFEAFQMTVENTQSLKDGTRNAFGLSRGFSTTTYWSPSYTEEGTSFFLEKSIAGYFDNYNTMILWMTDNRTIHGYIASGSQTYQAWSTEDQWVHAGTIQANRPVTGMRVLPVNLANTSGSNLGFTVYTGAVASQDIRAVVKFLKVEYRRK